MKYDRLWERLMEYLNEWATARELPGGIEVTFEQSPGVTRTIEVVLSLAEWDDYVSLMYGTGDPRATPIKSAVLAMPEGVRYLVYDTYDWEPSKTRELPTDEFGLAIRGEWIVKGANGNAIDRFGDWKEPDSFS
jgi:hypothetical protein